MREIVRSKRGWGHAQIAALVGCSVPTLRKYFGAELKPEAGATLFEVEPQPVKARGRKGGRRRYEPTARERGDVALLIASNVSIAAIAKRLGISEPTLRRAFARELGAAYEIIRADLLIDMRRSAAKGSVAAQAKLVEFLDRAELERTQESFAPSEGKPGKAESVGKKIEAQRAAVEAANETDLARLLDYEMPETRPN